MKKYLLFIAVLAILISSILDVLSVSSTGEHNIRQQIICESCHENIVSEFAQTISPYKDHLSEYNGCTGCHTTDGVHSAKIRKCTDCHQADTHIQKYDNCNECHQPHGGQITGIRHGNGYTCLNCHNIRR